MKHPQFNSLLWSCVFQWSLSSHVVCIILIYNYTRYVPVIEKAKQDNWFNTLCFLCVGQGQHSWCQYNFYSKKINSELFFWFLRCSEKTNILPCSVSARWSFCAVENIPLPCNSHANNFLLFLFAHQTHAARLLFSLSSPQYFMPLKVHLFLAFPMPYHLPPVKT